MASNIIRGISGLDVDDFVHEFGGGGVRAFGQLPQFANERSSVERLF